MPVCGGWASCVCRYLATNECPAPYPLRDFRALATPASSPLPFSYLPFPKRNRPTSVSGGSRLRYWLCPPPLSAHNWDGLLRLYSFSVRHCNKQVRDAASPKSGILAEPFPQLLALGSWWSKVELRRIPLLETVWKVAVRAGSRYLGSAKRPKWCPFAPLRRLVGS